MTEPNHQPTPDILERAAEALRAAPVPPGPSADLLAATIADSRSYQRRRRMFRYIRFGSASAALAAAVTLVLVFWPSPSPAMVLEKAAENAERASSMRAVVTLDPGQGQKKLEVKLYQQGDSMRIESANPALVVVVNGEEQKGLVLLPQMKAAWFLDPRTDPTVSNVMKRVSGATKMMGRPLKEGKFTVLPDETLDGRKVKVYERKGVKVPDLKGEGDLKVWIDPKRLLPVRAEVRLQQGNKTVTATLNVLGWSEELDPKLFEMTVLKGYKVIEQPEPPKKGDKPEPRESEPETGPAQFVLFRRAMDNADKAKSVRVIHKTNRYGKWATESTDYYQGDRVRAEVGVLLVVVDGTAKKRLELNTATKTARLRDMTEPELREHKRQQLNWLTEPLQPLRHLQDDKDYTVRELPSERQNGRRVKVYQIDHTAGGKTDRRIKLSVDAKTELPIRAHIEGAKAETNPLSSDALMNRNRPPTTIIEYEDWNKEFDAKLFSLEVPKGYRISDHPLRDTEPPPEETQFILFRRAMGNAEKAKTVRFTWTQIDGPPGRKGISFSTRNGVTRQYEWSSESTWTVIAKGNKVRIESGQKPARLVNYKANTGLILDHKYKIALRFTPGGKQGDWYGIFDRLAKLKPENVKPIGKEMVGKVTATKYELTKLERTGVIAGDIWQGATWTVWIDPKTNLPVRLRYMLNENLKWVFEGFIWNEPADDALFELKVPEGYTLEEATPLKKGGK